VLGRLWTSLVRRALLPALDLDDYHSRLKRVEVETRRLSEELGSLSDRVTCAEEFTAYEESKSGR